MVLPPRFDQSPRMENKEPMVMNRRVVRPVHTVRLQCRFFLSKLMSCTIFNGSVHTVRLQQHHQSLMALFSPLVANRTG